MTVFFKRILAAAALWLAASFAPAHAQLTSYTALDSTGATKTFNAITCGGNLCPITILTDATGASIYGTAGTANANVLSVQGVAGGTAVPVTGTVTANLGTIAGVATSALQTTGNTALGTINTTLGSPMQNTGGSVTANLGTIGAVATQTTLASIDAKTPALGQQLAAASSPVVLTAIQVAALTPLTSVAVTNAGTFVVQLSGATNNINNIAGTISLPTGAGTAANQATIITALNTLNTNVTSPPPLNVNTVSTAWTGLTPGATATAQTGTIIAANMDLSSQAGVALAAPTAYGTAPTGRALSANAFVTNTVTITGSLSANQSTNTAQVNGVTTLTGTGATGPGAQRVTVATDQATNAGAALAKGGVGVVNGGSDYEAVAASQTAQALGATGAAGDYLSHCNIYPTSTSPGTVTVFDGSNTAANSAILFPGGASSVSNLVPFPMPVGAVSKNGAWQVTTTTAVSVVCFGKFT